jgi:hypothetical protein
MRLLAVGLTLAPRAKPRETEHDRADRSRLQVQRPAHLRPRATHAAFWPGSWAQPPVSLYAVHRRWTAR